MSDNVPPLPSPTSTYQRSTRPRDQNLPGWNDPPPLQSSTQSTGVKSKLNLKKRVVFPLNNSSSLKPTAIIPPQLVSTSLPTPSTSAINNTAPIAIVPPMPQQLSQSAYVQQSCSQTPPSSAQPILRVPPMIPSPNEETSAVNLQDYCINIFQQLLQNSQAEDNSDLFQGIKLIKESWNEYNASIHRKLFNIAKALESKNFIDAVENHRLLVIDHSKVSIYWAPALRQIILTTQKKNNDEANDIHKTTALPLINPEIFSLSNTEPKNNSALETNCTKASISPFSVQHI